MLHAMSRGCIGLLLHLSAVAVATPAGADQAALDKCLYEFDDIEFYIEEFLWPSDDCAYLKGDIADYEAAIRDLRSLRNGLCRPELIAGGTMSAQEIGTFVGKLDRYGNDLTEELEGMRKKLPSCPATPDPPAAAQKDSAAKSDKGSKQPRDFAFTVCNKDSEEAHIAIAHVAEPGSGDYWVEGWWPIAAGECRSLGRFVRGWFYYYAEAENGEWSGDHRICVVYDRFKRLDYEDSNTQCSDAELKYFNAVQVKSEEFTANLNP